MIVKKIMTPPERTVFVQIFKNMKIFLDKFKIYITFICKLLLFQKKVI